MLENLTHSNLDFLKELSKYTLESKLLTCQEMSSRIMTSSKVDMGRAYKENIMPWEIETFAAYSIIYNSDDATEVIDWKAFGQIITLIRNYWHEGLTKAEKEGEYPETYLMISALQQFPVQGVFLQKLFRYNFFFTFQNDYVDMKQIFLKKIGVPYERLEEFAYIFFVFSSKDAVGNIPSGDVKKVWQATLSDKDVFNLLTIDEAEYRKELKSLYGDNIIDLYYGLKIQYLFPFVSGKKYTYIPSPYLVVNAVTESMLNRVTEGDNELRKKIGKEVIENYVFCIIKELGTVTWISREIEYFCGKNRLLTPDVLAAEGNNIVFYDTKAISPSLKLRKFDKREIENDIKIYAEDVEQIYYRIRDYIDGLFQLDKDYSKENIFGIIVVLEDAVVSRKRVYEKAFSLIEDAFSLTDEEKRFISSHIKILPLRSIENSVLENKSILPVLLKQINEPDKWYNYNYSNESLGHSGIQIYEQYVNDIKSRVKKKIKSVIEE